MKRLGDKAQAVLLIVLILSISINLWNGWKEAQLNQRYEDSLIRYEQSNREHEQANREYIEYLKNSRERLELMIKKAEQAAVN